MTTMRHTFLCTDKELHHLAGGQKTFGRTKSFWDDQKVGEPKNLTAEKAEDSDAGGSNNFT